MVIANNARRKLAFALLLSIGFSFGFVTNPVRSQGIQKSASFSLDLKSLLGQKKEGEAGSQGASPSSSDSQASARKIPEYSQIKLGGPDVMGFKTGMTLKEVDGIFKTKILNEGRFKGSRYLSDEDHLSKQGFGRRPNSKYTRYVKAWKSDSNTLTAQFTPVPQGERLVSFSRNESYAVNEQTTYENFRKALFDKYGEPTFYPEGKDSQFYWYFDADGKLQPPGKSVNICNHFGGYAELGLSKKDPWWNERGKAKSSCPVYVLKIELRADGGAARVNLEKNPKQNVKIAEMTVINNDVYLSGGLVAQGMIDDFVAKQEAERVKQAESNKPKL